MCDTVRVVACASVAPAPPVGSATTPSRPEYGHVYFIEAEGCDMVKIGRADNALDRLRTLQTASPHRLILRGVIHVDDTPQFEKRLHMRFQDDRVRGEWFQISAQIREFMDDCLWSIDGPMRICLRPQPPELRPYSVVHRGATETEGEFNERVCRVMEAHGYEVEREPVAA